MRHIKERIKKSLFYPVIKKCYFFLMHIFYRFGYIRNYIFFPISGYLRLMHFPFFYKNYKFIDEIRNKHKGKRCFIIATGPSLKIKDIEKLENEVSIGLNSLYKAYSKTEFRPTYYTVLDPDVEKSVVKDFSEDLSHLAKECVFFNSIVRSRFKSVKYLPYCYQNHWFNIFNPNFDHTRNLKFTNNLLYGIYDKYTVTTAAIDLAIHMGCKEIYLIGVDCNYSGPLKHFNDDDCNFDSMQSYYTQIAMMAGYRFMEVEAKKRGVKIYNATRGGMLEEFDRVNFDDLF